MSTWTKESEDLLRTLWTQGLSAKMIAKQITERFRQGVTRNAVISKRVRLGLPDRIKTTRMHAPLRTLRAISRASAPKLTPTPRLSRPPIHPAPASKRCAPKDSPSRMEHRHAKDFTHCKMFLEGESLDTGYVCGKPAMHGVYCAECFSLTHEPAKQREAA